MLQVKYIHIQIASKLFLIVNMLNIIEFMHLKLIYDYNKNKGTIGITMTPVEFCLSILDRHQYSPGGK